MSKTRTSTAPLESILVDWMRDRRSGTLRFEDADGLPHTLSLIDGIRVIVGAPASSGTGPDHRRSQAYHAADILFRKSASAPQITLDPKRPVPPPDAVSLDAFEVLYRGVRARYASSPPRATVTASDAPFVLHAEADLDVFPLRPGEEKLVAHLRNLSRSLEDLRAKAFLPDDELVTFLHFLLVTHNVFRLGEDTSRLEPLGEISPEERLLREPRDDDAAKLSPFASRLGLALLGLALVPLGLHLLSGDDIPSRIVQTTHTTPEIARHVAMSDERLRDLLRVVPGGKLEGALFPHDSHAHWALAGAALIGFLALSAFVFRRGRASPGDLL